MKIVSTGSTLSSPEFHEKRKKARRRRLYLWTAGALTLSALLTFLSRQEKFLISKAEVEGAKAVNQDEVISLVQSHLSGYYFWLLPRSNFVIYPRRDIKKSLFKEFPRFASVDLALEGTRLLSIVVVEREPFALYCASALLPDDASQCYFLDENGFIFDQAPSFSGHVYFIYAKDVPVEEPLGKEFLTPLEFKPLTRFANSLSILGINPLSMEVREEEVNLILPHQTRIRWRRSSDLNVLYSNLEAFLKDDAIKSEVNFLEKVSVLDLRTDNKVFYRFKE